MAIDPTLQNVDTDWSQTQDVFTQTPKPVAEVTTENKDTTTNVASAGTSPASATDPKPKATDTQVAYRDTVRVGSTRYDFENEGQDAAQQFLDYIADQKAKGVKLKQSKIDQIRASGAYKGFKKEESTATTGTTGTTDTGVTGSENVNDITKLTLNEDYAQYVGNTLNRDATTAQREVDGIKIPDWVDNDYLQSYVNSAKEGNPRTPNARELTEMIAGVPIEQLYGTMQPAEHAKYTNLSNSLLYGVAGGHTDTRDWHTIIESAAIYGTSGEVGDTGVAKFGYDSKKLISAIQIATSQMYGGTTVQFRLTKNPDGKDIPMAYITTNNGEILTSLSGSDSDFSTLANFGVQGTDWIAPLKARFGSMGVPMTAQWGYFFNNAETSYNPFKDYANLANQKFVTGLAAKIQPTTTTTTTEDQQQQQTQQQTQQQQQQDQIQQTIKPTTTTGYTLPKDYSGTGYLPKLDTAATTGVASTLPQAGTFTTAGTGLYSTAGTAPKATTLPTTQTQTTVAPTYTTTPTVQMPTVQAPTVQTPVAPTVQTQTPLRGYATQFDQGGMVNTITPPPEQNRFGGFKPQAMQRIAGSLGYTGDMVGFDSYLAANPDKKQQMDRYTEKAMEMANGGMIKKYTKGGLETNTTNESTTTSLEQYMPRVLQQQYIPPQTFPEGSNIQTVQAQQAKNPGLPLGATVVPVGTQITGDQLMSPYTGQVTGSVNLPTTLAMTNQAGLPTQTSANIMAAAQAAPAVEQALQQTTAQQNVQVPTVQGVTQGQTAISALDAAQTAGGVQIVSPQPRQVVADEIIAPAANAQQAAQFTEQVQAATATPSTQATVQGQLEGLMQQFEGGQTPAWAAGAMRNATATMIARGLGASSIAGQAIVQAAMEAALPIAQMDSQTVAKFEAQNLSNRQQRAMAAAQQRAQFLGQEFDQTFQSRVANAAKVSDVANMNFTAEQQVALENSRIANTANLANLTNRQAMVMAEAGALSNLEMAGLSNVQQAAVLNAQNFLQTDMANLNNRQQAEMFKSQQRVQSMFTDQAALNAAQQFNASTQNQVDQFFAQLGTNTAQFNATQANAQNQFNAGQVNTLERFNTEVNNQRDQFNAQNRLVIDQNNAQWRRQIATVDTAAVNRANEINAASLLGYSQTAYNNLWQYYADNMHWAWTSAENERSRLQELAVTQMQVDANKDLAKIKQDYQSSAAFGGLIGNLLTTDLSKSLAGSVLGGLF